MKKMTKRMLSMFLAAVLVFTTVPFSALVAFAKRTGNDATTSSAYLTNGIDEAFTNNNVTWDSTEKAAKFTGSNYLQMNSNPLANVTADGEFAISFDVKKDSSTPDNGRIVDVNDGTTSNTFAINGGSDTTNNWRRGMTLAKVNDSECSYYSNDLGDATMTTGGGSGWVLESGVWHNVTVYMAADGAYSYYIDGALKGTFKANYSDTAVSGDRAHGVTATAIRQAFATMTNFRVGKSIYNDAGFVGYIKNLQFLSFTNPAVTLKTAMDAYEAKMADGKIYTNLSNAYDAYQQASARYDAYIYGESDPTDATVNAALIGAAQELTLATGAMQPWVEYSGTKPMYSGTIATGAYSNVLYAPGQGQGAMSFSSDYVKIGTTSWTNNKHTAFKGWAPSSAVFYYNGDLSKIYFPVGFEAYANSSSNRTVQYVDWNGDANVEVTRYWYGYQQGWNNDYGVNYDNCVNNVDGSSDKNDGDHVSVGYSSSNTKNHTLSKDGDSKKRYWVNIGHIKALSSNTLSKTSLTMRMKTDYGTGTNAVSTGIYVVNYYQLTQAIKNNKSKVAGIDVTNYKEGGLATALSTYDIATSYDITKYKTGYNTTTYLGGTEAVVSASSASAYYNYAQGACTKFASDLGSIATPAVDTNYKALKDAIDYEGQIAAGDTITVLFANSKRTSTSTTDGANNGGYIKGLYKTFATKYDAAVAAMAALSDKTAYPTTSVATTASDLTTAFSALNVADITKPTVTPVSGRLLSPTDTVTILNPEAAKNRGGHTSYNVAFSDSSAAVTGDITGSTANATVTPFSGKDTAGLTATVTAQSSAVLSGDTYSMDSDTYTYTLYSSPSIANTNVAYNEGIVIDSTNAQKGTIQYSLDGNTWNNYDAQNPYVPFSGTTASSIDFYVRETKTLNDADSQSYTVTSASKRYVLERNADFDIKAKYSDGSVHANGANYYDENSTFWIDNAGTYTANITYTIYVDGNNIGSFTYEPATGIAMTSAIQNASFIKIIAFATDRHNDTIQTEKTFFNANNFSPLLYRESFDGASVSAGTVMTTGSSKGLNLTGTSTLEVLDGAGWVNSSYNASPDWRNNVLKISANSTKPGPVVTAASNPLTTQINAAAVKSEGVTISFWRYLERNGACADLDTHGTDPTGYVWRNAIAFQDSTRADNYYLIEVNGVQSRCETTGTNYFDYAQNNQDETLHAAGNARGNWVNVVVTIDPNSGVMLYTNGDPHPVKINKGMGTLSAGNSAETAQEILNFITNSNTNFTFDNGVVWEGNDYDLYLDDIRIYAEVKSQVDIYNMYNDSLADVQTNTQNTSHDPTAVTVFTLNNDKKVGIEYFRGAEPSGYKSVEYYNFGTGMTVYHSTDNVNWEVIGDSEGRCGYQNQDLFGGVYYERLAGAVNWVDPSGNHAGGAGRLVWAPHVMYNISLNKWVYYGSMSSWGARRSAIFMATSDYPDHGYTYETLVYKSNTACPNAIDPVTYYDASYENLYMIWGSWAWTNNNVTTNDEDGVGNFDWSAIVGMKLQANGRYSGAINSGEDTTLREDDQIQNVGHEVAAVARGYMSDLERPDHTSQGETQGSGEGAYVTHETVGGTTYYYLWVSYGQNTGSYAERVFRSENPLGPFKGFNGIAANNKQVNNQVTSTTKNRGNQILAPFDIKLYDYLYVSTGHNSVYKVKNNSGEWVTLNSVHARPYANANHGWVALPDAALAKRQSDVTGNVTLNNMISYTENGWPVMFPSQYDGTDSVSREITAYDLEGIYTADDFGLYVTTPSEVLHNEYTFTMLAKSATSGIAYGAKDINGTSVEFTSRFEIEYKNNTNYITIYTSAKEGNTDIRYRGVIASKTVTKTVNGKVKTTLIPMIGMINQYEDEGYWDGSKSKWVDGSIHSQAIGEQTWAYRSADIPDVDKVISQGDLVSSTGVIYTHASDEEVLATYGVTNGTDAQKELALKSGYALYGQEISNNWNYGQKDANDQYTSGGERFTTIATAYPAYIPMETATGRSAPGAIISLNDTEYCRDYGETGSNMYATALNDGWWCSKNTDGSYTKVTQSDADAKTAKQNGTVLYKVYGITGSVSSFFRYYDNETDATGTLRNGYPKVGVTLVVAYKDVVTGADYSEFEFCYVMPNPAWAHTIAATKNGHTDLGNNRNSSYGIFNRFEGSYGEATDYSSSFLYYSSTGTTQETGWGYGTSGYLTDFSSQSFSDTDLDTLDEIKTLMNKSPNAAAGVNAGSFAAWTHVDDCPNAFTAAPQVINTQYYVDYSDKSNYIKNNPNTGLITSGSNNTSDTPTGYQFKMRTSNFLWANYSGSSILDVTSYAMNNTGLNVSYSSTAAGTQPYNKSTQDGSYHSDFTGSAIYDTNYQEIKSCNKIMGVDSGKTAFKEDGFLFMTDERSSSDAIIATDYRNKLLYYFSSGTNHALMTPLKDTANNSQNYLDGTSKSGTPGQIYDFRQNQAYTTASNGKLSTNAWQGTATFTGKDTLKQNTVADLQTIGNASSSDTLVYEDGRLYDGYYYYTNEHNDIKREHWTSSQSYAQNNTATTSGRIDVTAENYANYILEMGNYHKITDIGADGGRFIGSDTYHYYNIGVATCDKGAARDFMENFALKRLVAPKGEDGKRHVTLDANGRPTVDTNMDETQGEVIGDAEGNLYVENISAKSYRDYIDALARLEWFVNNPTNTVQNDLASEDEYEDLHSVMTSSDEYVTAYNGTTPIYVTSNGGSNVFKDAGVTVNTDQVQAKLIADVIEAYEHLYTVEDYKEVEKEYKAIKEEIDAAKETGDYTEESIDDYEKNFKAIEKAVAYYTDLAGVTPDRVIDSELMDLNDIYDEDYWRYSDYSGADYDAIREALKEIKDSLMPKVVTSALENTSRVVKTPIVKAGIYTDGTQTLRYDQWAALYDKIVEADGEPFNTGDGVVQNETGKARYATTGTKSLNELLGVARDESDDSTKLDYNVYRLSSAPADGTAGTGSTIEEKSTAYGATYVDIGGGEFAKLSENQTDVNTENKELSDMNIGAVDDNSAYQSYNAAYTIVNSSINKDKYIASAQAKIDEALSTRYSSYTDKSENKKYGPVYVKATAAQASTYATVTGKADIKVDDDLMTTGGKETDPITAKLLELVSVLEADNTYVKQFTVTYDVTNGNNTYETVVKNPYYGDVVEFDIPNEAQANAKFNIQFYDGQKADYDATGDFSGVNATSSTKEATYNGTKLSRVAKSNMAITAKVTNKTAVADQYTVRIRNIYGTVVAIYYCAKADLPEANTVTFTIGGETVKPEEVPFYTFSKWEKVIDDENKTADYTAKYNAGDSLTLAVEGDGASVASGAAATAEGATTYTTTFDTLVTLDYSGSDEFAAWATVIDDGGIKYQIASYSPSYSFYAVNGNGTIDGVTGEKFVPVVKVEGKYKVGETELTAANVDTVYDVTYDGNGVVTADKILYQKLADKAPFVTTVGAQMGNGNKAATVYCRVTEGYNVNYKPSEIALLARSYHVDKGQEKATMVPSVARKFKTSTILSTGQFVYTISKSSGFTERVLFRGYITYDFNYKFTGTNTDINASAKLNIAEYSDFVAQATK